MHEIRDHGIGPDGSRGGAGRDNSVNYNDGVRKGRLISGISPREHV